MTFQHSETPLDDNIITVADLRGARGGPDSFNFMQFLGKFGKIICWRSPLPGELAPPPRGNPGSATALGANKFQRRVG